METYDGIVLGAGHHGLILATYLARQGLRVLLAERRLVAGGGLMTEERTLPGFHHNLHSINHFDITNTPWFRDLQLERRVEYLTPQYEFAQPHDDGTALVFSRDLEETLASIARFSPRDARTFAEWNAKAEEITRSIFLTERFSEPLDEDRRRELLEASSLGREFLSMIGQQPIDAVTGLFENERVQVLFLFKLSLFGTVLHETFGEQSPVGSLVRAFDLATGYQICAGGSWNLARGLMEEFVVAGGHYVNQAEAARIVVESGRAVGVEFTDGRSARASRFVASTLNVHQTFDDLIGRDAFSDVFGARVDDFHYTRWTLYGLHLALREPPRYASGAFDPNVDRALKYNVGAESLEQLSAIHADVEAGKVPASIHFGAGALTQLDPRQAPPGMHTAYAWHLMPYEPDGDHERLKELEAEFADRILDRWRDYAPNVNGDNILASSVYTAYEYARDLVNMHRGDIFMGALSADQVMHNHFGYRTPIEGLYLAGSATHPGGAISGGAGYIVAGLIARDLGLDPWWRPVDAAKALAELAD